MYTIAKCQYKRNDEKFILVLTDRKDLRALTLVGPTRENLVPDPLAVQHLDNRVYLGISISTEVA